MFSTKDALLALGILVLASAAGAYAGHVLYKVCFGKLDQRVQAEADEWAGAREADERRDLGSEE